MLHQILADRLRPAVTAVLPDADLSAVRVRPCPDPKFGDYQTSALMTLAKERRINPRQFASQVLGHLDARDWCDQVELAGAGFLNFRVSLSALGRLLGAAARGEHLLFSKAARPKTVLLDFSSPNVAKPMHVGHIRSTILGDCLSRILRLLGHRVISDNHIGDWGTQFGKLLVGWKQQLDRSFLERDPISEMERLYKTVNAACEKDQAVLETARQELVKLQDGDPENLALWQEMRRLSQQDFDRIYQRLGVRFDHMLGESFYNSRLKGVVRELVDKGIARESEGAMVVFFDDHPALTGHPAIVQKSDGAANYTTTDLATLAYRIEQWNPDEVIYVTDGRQQLHFSQLFEIFRRWQPQARLRLTHVWFGTIFGEDGKPFKARSGEAIRLVDLLDEAEQRALRVVTEKNPDLNPAQRAEIARAVGLGAVKYADLLPNRQTDYVFSWDKMLALNGNTAPYLQYAYTRTRSLLRKLEGGPASEVNAVPDELSLTLPEEVALAKQLANFGFVLEAVTEEYRPNYLCTYLYDLAGCFARFWENCPVLKAEAAAQPTRLALCDLTSRILKQGLNSLGIDTLEQM